jgi:hypothetical protein
LQGDLNVGFAPGSYNLAITIDTHGKESSDDAAPPYTAGNYTLQVFFCEGGRS